MPSIAQIADAMTGSLLLARRDTGGYGYFDVSFGGFWRSFLAFFLILPLYLSISAAEQSLALDLGDRANAYDDNIRLIRFLALIAGWIAFPLVMVWVCQALQLRQRYVLFITVYNWSSVPAMAALTLPFLLYQIGVFEAPGTALLYLVMIVSVVYYRWFIAHTALQTTTVNAAGIVALDLLLSFVIWSGLNRMFVWVATSPHQSASGVTG